MKDVTDATFATDVIERSKTVPVVVDLWATWCGPCTTLSPIIEKVIDETSGAVELAKVDVDANPDISRAFQVQSIPAVFAIKDGAIVDSFVGALPEGQRADGENTESDLAGWTTPRAAIDEFEAGRLFLLPPTWTQLDSLAGRNVAEVLAVERQIVTVQPHLEIQGDNWIFEFFDSDRYHRAREAGGLGWRH